MNKGTAVIAILVAFIGGYFLGNVTGQKDGGRAPGGVTEKGDAPSKEKGQDEKERFRVMVGRSPQKGPKTALVTIVEFSEFECPFCSRVAPTLQKLQQEFGDKVRIVFKHNPLPFHPNALPAAHAAAAAAQQGKFWEYHDKLFANQKALSAADLEKYAQEVGLDVEKWKKDKEDELVKRQVQADMALGRRLGVRGTPNFFINGRPLQGAQPYEAFANLVREEIEHAQTVLKRGVQPERLYAEIVRSGKTSASGADRGRDRRRPQVDDKTVYKVPVGDSPVKGPKDALITIVEFSEFQCPFCKRVLPTIKQIEETYGSKVRIAFKHNPLPFHKAAMPAALAAYAAAKQGKFWQFHDKLFESDQRSMTEESIDKVAEEIGLDMVRYKADKSSSAAQEAVKNDQRLALQLGARGTPSFFINGRNLRGAQPFPRFKALIDEELAKAEEAVKKGTKPSEYYASIMKNAKEKADAPPPRQRPGSPDPNTVYKVPVGDSHFKGPKTAPVTIVEFSEFQCPFCNRVLPTLQEVQKTFGNKVRIVFKHQPLPFHKNAALAAEAAEAAGEQGKFWQMHDKLFANQKQLERADLEKYAEELGLNMAKFKAALDSGKFKSKVQNDQKLALQVGARGTPTFFVNGKPLIGAQPFDAFKSRIEEELKNAEALLKKGIKPASLYEEIIKNGKDQVEATAQAPGGRGPSNVVQHIDPGDSPSKGPKNAPVTIIEFSEFQCPFCARALPTLQQVMDTYKGKVRIVFKHYPLPFHKDAMLAAQASMAAYEQGKFWEMHDKLFANQRALSRSDLEKYAEEIGLDMGKFKAALDSEKFKSRVQADMKLVTGIGTPTFYINGRQLVGAQPFDSFKSVIDEELKKAQAKRR